MNRYELLSFFDCLQFPAYRLLTSTDKMTVDAVLLYQFIVCATLNDLSLVHYKDLIGIADGFQAVSYTHLTLPTKLEV